MNLNKTFHIDKLYVVADFDHTLTTKDSQNCWGILSTIPNISKDYIKESKQNNDYYFPIEQNDSIDYETKNEIMRNWYENHVNMLVKYNVKEKDLNDISQSESIILRKGVVEFLKYTNKNNIPVIIISAGISNIIEGVLKKHNCFFNNIYIISNIFKFKDGKVKSLRNKIIHSLNKNKLEIPPKINETLKNRDEAIILGDNIGDTLMTLKENKINFKIGFLNYNDSNKLAIFQKYFDIVYNENDTFLKIVDLISNVENV